MSSFAWDEDLEDYLDVVQDENGVVQPVQELPEGWTHFHLPKVLGAMHGQGATLLGVKVLLTLLNVAEPYTQEISLGLRDLAVRAGVSIGTVQRATRYWEDQGVIAKTSKPNQGSRWLLNPAYSCKVFPHGE